MSMEISPDQMYAFTVYDREYEVSAATDAVVRFNDPAYDYLRYLNPEEHAVTLEFLPQGVLSGLVAYGIPETRKRAKIMQCEHEEYITWQQMYGMAEFETEVADIPEPTEGFDDAA